MHECQRRWFNILLVSVRK